MAFSTDDIERINRTRTAVLDEIYDCVDGRNFIGMSGGWLLLKESATNTSVVETDNVSGKNVQEALVNAGNGKPYKKQIVIDFGAKEFEDTLYVSVKDNTVKSDSSIIASVTVSSNKQVDELEFTNFTCSIVDIVSGVGYKVLVIDQNRQAEGAYILNIIKN